MGRYGIRESLKKITFAEDVFGDRIVRGSFENPEYYSQKGVLVRDPHRKDRGIKDAFKRNGFKAPYLGVIVENDVENQNIIKDSTNRKYRFDDER